MSDRSELEDAELVGRVLGGDGESFAVLMGRYADALGSLAYLKVRNGEEARDIVQAAFFTAYRGLSDLAEPARFGAWLKGIALNLARQTLETKTRHQRLRDRLPRPPKAPDPVEDLTGREYAQRIIKALDELDEPHREVVTLHYLEGVKVELIGRLVDRPAGTVKRMLSEARETLREELIEMAREEFADYRLTEEQRERLAKIAEFPRSEPKISITRLDEAAQKVRTLAAYGTFPELAAGAEACYADYDHPGCKLKQVSHVVVEGPVDVPGEGGGTPALRVNDMDFSPEGKAESVWMPYWSVDGDTYSFCAKQHGGAGGPLPIVTPDDPEWDDGPRRTDSFVVEPGTTQEPAEGDKFLRRVDGFIVDANLHEVKIGKRSFRCVKRTTAGDRVDVDWSDSPVTYCATEEYFLEDGRLLLWRRYNGEFWSKRDPNAGGNTRALAEAGVPGIEAFGEKYYLWYDQVPDYALH